jgi:hypothetical protein
MQLKNHIIFFSGGKSSFSAADYVKTNFPDDNIVLYFTDTQWENDDLYRFIYQASDRLELPMLTHSLGLNPLELMFEKKLVFNSMIGDCSKILKIKVSNDFIRKGIKPSIEKWRNKQFLKADNFTENPILYYGIGFEEMHREGAIRKNWKPYQVEMPLIDNIIDNDEILKKYNLRQPVLYEQGFSHNNCNARCVKAGQGHYKNLYHKNPELFLEIMRQEHHMKMYVSAFRYITNDKVPKEDQIPKDVQELEISRLEDAYRDYFYGKADKPKLYIHPAVSAAPRYSEIQQYSFMKKSVDSEANPYPIRELYFDIVGKPFDTYGMKVGNDYQMDIFEFMEKKPDVDIFDVGGCGCFTDYSSCELD